MSLGLCRLCRPMEDADETNIYKKNELCLRDGKHTEMQKRIKKRKKKHVNRNAKTMERFDANGNKAPKPRHVLDRVWG